MLKFHCLSCNLFSTVPRHCSAEEVRKSVKIVTSIHEFLNAALSNSKLKAMVNKKFYQIDKTINPLGGETKLDVEKEKKVI